MRVLWWHRAWFAVIYGAHHLALQSRWQKRSAAAAWLLSADEAAAVEQRDVVANNKKRSVEGLKERLKRSTNMEVRTMPVSQSVWLG